MSKQGTVVDGQTVRFVRTLPGPIERVWEYITNPEKRMRWLAGGITEPRVGGKVVMEFVHTRISDTPEPTPVEFKKIENGCGFEGRVLRWEPHTLFAMSWGSEKGVPDSEVEFSLVQQGKDVLLTLTHRKLPTRHEMLSVSGGWHAHLDILEDELVLGRRRAFWANFLANRGQYEGIVPVNAGA